MRNIDLKNTKSAHTFPHSFQFTVFPSVMISIVFRPIVLSRNGIEWLDDGSESRDRYLKKDGPRVLVERNRREMVIDTHREAKRGRLAVDLLGLVQTIPRRWLCLVVTSFRRSASFVDSLRIYTYTDAYMISYICHDKSIPNSRMRFHRK